MRASLLCAAAAAMLMLAPSADARPPAAGDAGHSAGAPGHSDTTTSSATPSSPSTATTTTPSSPSATTTATDTAQRGPAQTGQPNQSCEDLGNRPGNAANAPGSAFNPDGNAGTHYAGEQPQNSRNTASVSQYDTACARPTH
jgi:hypothetical protein